MITDRGMGKTLCDRLEVVNGIPECRIAHHDWCKYVTVILDGEKGDRYVCNYVIRILEVYSGVDILEKQDHIPLDSYDQGEEN